MRAASLETSKRLQRVLKCLRDGKPRTTRTIIRESHTCAISSAVAELRENGFDIECKRKGRYWYYRLVLEIAA